MQDQSLGATSEPWLGNGKPAWLPMLDVQNDALLASAHGCAQIFPQSSSMQLFCAHWWSRLAQVWVAHLTDS